MQAGVRKLVEEGASGHSVWRNPMDILAEVDDISGHKGVHQAVGMAAVMADDIVLTFLHHGCELAGMESPSVPCSLLAFPSFYADI